MSTHQGDASRRGQGSDEVVLKGIACGGGSGSDSQLIENGRDMCADRRQTHHQPLGHLRIGQAFG